ncbi:hypothetical protein NCCP2716_20050 [Sporosarcina sp. NCCP-2716]|uniref:hypothetical protein n=1 Tax=Sporosarcina sp. NCCP-2716 TaxID=2943679 RepID=UPI00203F1577|nr:hypothetical protein [Sporosarcina sp. NCCP-2716]GKV69507.1 hypothetical protein NCCP2716_20050 [Sporosarcina sp. NCCP-2716]
MTEADEIALSFYVPLLLILAVVDMTVSAYRSADGKHPGVYAIFNLLLNMSWTCALFPLLLDLDLLSRSMEAIYEGSRREVHPFSERGLFWFSALLITLFTIVTTVDVHQGFDSAKHADPSD